MNKSQIINTIIIWVTGAMWLYGIFVAGFMVVGQSINFERYDTFPTIDAFFITGAAGVALALAGLVLFLMRKRAGWIILVIGLLVGAVRSAIYYVGKIVDNYGRIKELAEYNGGYDDDLTALLWKGHHTTVVAVLTILVMWAITWWFIRRRSLCEIYKVGRRTVLYTCCGAAALVALDIAVRENLFRNAESATKITQTDSGEQVVVWRSKKNDRISNIDIPLAFEYRNLSLKKRGIGLDFKGVEYKQKDWALHEPDDVSQGWEDYVYHLYLVDDKLKSGSDLRFREAYIDRFGHLELVAFTRHRVDTASVVQARFRPLVERMKETGADSLSLGTLREFARQYLDLAETMLKGDSIRFSICNRWHHNGILVSDRDKKTLEAMVTLPVEYKY